jgi:hypothetical protein
MDYVGPVTLCDLTVIFKEDSFTCNCGNIAENAGFSFADPMGTAQTHTDPDWAGHYLCNDCSLVIHEESRTFYVAPQYTSKAEALLVYRRITHMDRLRTEPEAPLYREIVRTDATVAAIYAEAAKQGAGHLEHWELAFVERMAAQLDALDHIAPDTVREIAHRAAADPWAAAAGATAAAV